MRYDRADAFFFLDPPYAGYDAFRIVGTDHRGWDEKRFARVLRAIKGKFLCTYGIRGDQSLFKGFRLSRIRHRSRANANTTLLISNYEWPKHAARVKSALCRWPADMNGPDEYEPWLDWS